MKKKVAISGCGVVPNATKLADEGFDLWTMNNCWKKTPDAPWTAVFELHRVEKICARYYRRDSLNMGASTVDEYLKNLDELGVTVYVQERIPEIKKSRVFPFAKLIKRFPRGYFCNSFAWMLAYAIYKGYEEIHIYNCVTANDDFRDVYIHTKSTEYYIGVADALKIKVVVPHSELLLKGRYLYGLQENPYTYEQHKKAIAEWPLPYSDTLAFLSIDHV